MKNLSILTVIICAIGFNSCAQKTPTASFKTDVDSLSYAIGMAQTNGLLPYLSNMGVDSTDIDDFIKGLNDGLAKADNKSKAYSMGEQIALQIKDQMIPGINQQLFIDSPDSLNKNNFIAGFIAGVEGKEEPMGMEEASNYTQKKVEEIQEKSLMNDYSDYKAEGEAFLEQNKTKEGVKTTDSGLQYEILVQGKGDTPKKTDQVKVHYVGTLIDGTEFDSSYGRGQAAVFGADQVIKGWTEALTMMPVGSKWKLYIPSDLAYGTQGQGQIKPFSTLIFEVELLDIVKE